MGRFLHRKSWRIWRIICQNFLANIHKYIKNIFGICTDCNLFTKFFLANSSYLYGLPKFSHVQYLYLYLNTSKNTCILLKYFSQNNAMYLYLYFTKCQSTCTLLKYFHMYFTSCLCPTQMYVSYFSRIHGDP